MPRVTQGHWEGDNYVYFYDQLRPEAKRFYDALLAMFETEEQVEAEQEMFSESGESKTDNKSE